MGLDLTLLPFEHESQGFAFSHSVLRLNRDSRLFEPILDIDNHFGRRVPEHFSTYLSRDDKYEEPHYGETQQTPYGQPLQEVEVERLLPLVELAVGPQNAAAWAYLAKLPPRTKIALYWS